MPTSKRQLRKDTGAVTGSDQIDPDKTQMIATQKLKDKAYQLLARREHSCHELRQKLARHDRDGQLESVMDALMIENAISDYRFAESLARSRYRAGKGPLVLEQELCHHRIAEEIIRQVMTGYQDAWRNLAEEVRRKKYGTAPPETYAEWAKQARFLQQRGFTAAEIGHYDGS